jgi:hypothetical protein
MGTVPLTPNAAEQGPYSGPTTQKPISLVHSTWHAASAGGAAIAWAAGFTDPSATECDRIPELALAGGGAAGTYTITGTWSGAAQTDTITTVAGSTVKGSFPFDTITSVTGPDPAAALNIYWGDTFADPPARCMWTGNGGDIYCQLWNEAAPNTAVITLPAQGEWVRRIRRINRTTTTVTGAFLCW